jgi:hypothetical protein
MSTTFAFAQKQLSIYCGTPVFFAGIVGGVLNTIVFLSLRTFRQSSCAFYLTIMSIFNVLVLSFGLSQSVFPALSGFDATVTSLFYCKFRAFFHVIAIETSMTCFCLATIDQYFATCSYPRFQQLCNIKLAQRIVIITIIFWVLHGIPFLVFFNHVASPTTNQVTCTNTNYTFEQYRIFFLILVVIGYLPIVTVALFGLMAYRNVKEIAYRTVPLVRRQLDKQITVMVLVQAVVYIFTLLPFTTVDAIVTSKIHTVDSVTQQKLQFAVTVTLILSFITFAVSIYKGLELNFSMFNYVISEPVLHLYLHI